MARKRPRRISLARQCQILFGSAVLVIVAASLVIPGMRLNDLMQDRYLQTAKEMATVALLTANPQGADDWSAAQTVLNREWPRLAKIGEFPSQPPRLITLKEAQALVAGGARGFIYESIERLQGNPENFYQFKFEEIDDKSQEVRLVFAVRASEAEANPGTLKGLIEVHLPIPPEERLSNMLLLAASFLCGGLLAVLVFYWVTQRLLLSPVRKLRRLAERVTTGDMDARSTIATGDEYEDLGNAFNDMLGHIQDTQDELRKINRSLDTRLGELAETNVALFESNRLKSEFIANVSHELRTPLVSIIGFAELLVESGDSAKFDQTRLMRYSTNILTSGRMLLEIINDLLDLAKIEAGRLELHIAEIEVSKLCESLLDFLAPLADKRELHLQFDISREDIRMKSDAGRIKQVLYNLLSNALKFTPSGGEVRLSVDQPDEAHVRFAVKDTGPGIPPEQQEEIFEKFRQLDASHTREYSGTGLGLAITRQLSTLLGGDVALESEEGQGSVFYVTLPVTAPLEHQPPPLINLT